MNCDKTGCPNEATGAIRIELWPHPAVQKMVVKPRPLLTMVMGLYTCERCVPTKVADVCDPKMLHALESHAARQHHGILVDRSQTKIVRIALDDPELLVMQQSLAKQQAANDSQPEGAGNGQTETPAA